MAGLQTDTDILAGLSKIPKETYAESDSGESQELQGDESYPTAEELHALRRVPDDVPWAAYLIAIVEFAERFSYYGTTVVFTNFIQQPLPKGSRTGAGGADVTAGALGMGQRASTGLTTFNSFWVYVTPLVGAYIADKYWGRYKTICVAVAIALFGHILLIISGLPSVISNNHGALACFIIAIVIMGCGTGGFKSNIAPLIGEQYRRTKHVVRTKKGGEKVIVDPSLTIQSIYMYFYLFTNIGALVGQIGMTYSERYVGFYLAFLLPTVVFLTAPVVLWIGRNRYIKSPPMGSVLGRSFRLWRYAAQGCWAWNPIRVYHNFNRADFWERVKPSVVAQTPAGKPRWMTFDDQWVDEVRRGLKACGVFVFFPIYWLTYNQLNNNLVSQAATMQTNGLPNDILNNLDPLFLIVFIPICDKFIYPALRRMGINFSPLKRITAGFFTGAAAMAWAAAVQHYIYKRNACHNFASTCVDANDDPIITNMNVWIQSGSYILIALSEIFASITGLEYAFTKAPRNMRSLVMSVYLFMNAFSSAIGEAFVSLSADPLLVWNYGVVGVIAAVTGVLFWLATRHLDAEEEELNKLAAGHLETDDHYESEKGSA